MQDEGAPSQPNINSTPQVPAETPPPVPQDPPVNYNEPVLQVEEARPSMILGFLKKLISLILILALIAGVGYGGYYLWGKYGKDMTQKVAPNSSDDISNENSKFEENDIKTDKVTYTNSTYSFRFNYPKDVTLREEQSGEIFIAKLGPTQKEGTELYDGIWLSITPGKLGTKSVKDMVDSRIKELSVQGNSKVIRQPELVTIAGKTAYRFDVEGLGTYIYYYLALGPDNYVVVVDGTRDPENVGFSSQVEEIIKSIEFLGPASSS